LGGLFKTLRKPASSGLASSTSGKSDDPIEALRRKFLPNSDGKATAPALQSSAASSKNDMTDVSSLSAALFKMPKSDTNGRPTTNNNNNRPQANSQQNNQNRAPDTSAAGSEKSKYQSPLSEFIRVIQMKHAEEKAKKDPEESPLSSVPRTPLPKWRLQTNRLREMRQRRNDQRNHGAELPARFQQRVREPRKRPVFVDPRSRMVTLPSHDISLTEASLLFRQRSMKLKRILRKLGERPKKASDNDDEMMLGVDSLELVALELGAKFQLSNRRVKPKDEEVLMQRRAAAEGTVKAGVASYESFASRPPVVCIMGHVDHGKTTLMDSLRQRALAASGGGGVKEKKPKKMSKKGGKKDSTSGSKNVAGTEAGGITQVISAFQVPLEDQDEVVTFLDTPGHAAFKAMRQSGSDAADIIVLVVAADDGISEQTIEILDFYKSIVKGSGGGGISLVVAMNKIDKPGIDVDESRMRIQNELYQQGILTEGLGGLGFSEEGEFGPPVQLIPVSGLTGLGVDELIEGLALQSEIMDLRADDTVRGEGIVLDARVVKGLGVVADCIIRWGSMQKGDVIVSGVHAGKIKMLKDPNDKMVTKGLPSQPVRLVGFETVPKAGDPIVCVESEEVAEDLVARRKASLVGNLETSTAVSSNAELQSSNKHMMHTEWKTRLEQKYSLNTEDGNAPIRIRIPVIIKADADGTLAAVRDSLVRVGDASSHNVFIDPVLVGVGPVLATDIQMAKESNAGIFCFNIKNEQLIEKLAGEEGVTLLRADVIYSLLDESKKVFANYLPPVPVEIMHGRAKVKAVYDIGGINSQVAGLSVVDGTLYKENTKGQSGMLSCQFRIVRDGKVISPEGALRATSLKHFKEDVFR
jgi:translation initiation factor IF-2